MPEDKVKEVPPAGDKSPQVSDSAARRAGGRKAREAAKAKAKEKKK